VFIVSRVVTLSNNEYKIYCYFEKIPVHEHYLPTPDLNRRAGVATSLTDQRGKESKRKATGVLHLTESANTLDKDFTIKLTCKLTYISIGKPEGKRPLGRPRR
jgi:hypothetical protein